MAWFFRKLKINIHLKEYLRAVTREHHEWIHGPYLSNWKAWIYKSVDWKNRQILVTRKQVLEHGRHMDWKYHTQGFSPPPSDSKVGRLFLRAINRFLQRKSSSRCDSFDTCEVSIPHIQGNCLRLFCFHFDSFLFEGGKRGFCSSRWRFRNVFPPRMNEYSPMN